MLRKTVGFFRMVYSQWLEKARSKVDEFDLNSNLKAIEIEKHGLMGKAIYNP
tara:strand:+ start:111 stop:266 length:156 start_codon:yes stop_codon:yes gene_type:complete